MTNLLDILYNVIVTPLIFLIGVVYEISSRVLVSPGLSLICVSIVVNVLCFPLYKMADDQQEEERKRQLSMERWVSHIKTHFKGDEQYMMLTTYYRQKGYKQYYALSNSISLLLQIPIFMAAYRYLSNLSALRGESFLFIQDLGAPDGLLQLGTVAINVLPVLMTLLNCVSTFIYTRDLGMRDRLQAYGLAVLFLVLLYKSPAGLVLYWTCNQIFSLLKNLFMKVVPNPKKTLGWILQACIVVLCVALISYGALSSARRIAALVVAVACIELFIWAFLLDKLPLSLGKLFPEDKRSYTPTFLLATGLCVALLGVLIPSALIGDSPTEFMSISSTESPLRYVVYTASVYFGFFFVWVGVYFFLSRPDGRKVFALVMWVLATIFLVDYLFFGKGLGIISTNLKFSELPVFSRKELVVNCLAILALIAALLLVWRFRHDLVNPMAAILLLATICLSVPNLMGIRSAFREYQANVASMGTGEDEDSGSNSLAPKPLFKEDGSINPLITLSKEGRNVVVLFLDRAIGAYVPYIAQEKPEVISQFDGFVYYPNSISYGMWTMVGAPAMAGGYEYTPLELNARDGELLMDKHDEALKVLPKVFSENGFHSVVLTPPLIHYVFNATDYSTFSDIEDVEVYSISGAYTDYVGDEYGPLYEENRYRSFVFYSLFKSVPVALQSTVYDQGNYYTTVISHSVNTNYVSEHAALSVLPELTEIEEGDGDNYVFCQNSAPHEPDELQLPDYVSSPVVNNAGYYDESLYTLNGVTMNMDVPEGFEHYCVNVGSFIELGKWFDYLRAEGVYDNTRIIIVSDHGNRLNQFEDFILSDSVDVESVNCLFMVKDFNATGPMVTSNEFMTNADTPSIALSGIVEDPINPYTGNPITDDAKHEGDQTVYFTAVWNSNTHREETQFDFGDGWLYSVHDNIFDRNNWEMLTEPTNAIE